MIPYLWGAFMYAVASKNATYVRNMSPEQRRELERKRDETFKYVVAVLAGVAVGLAINIASELHLNSMSDNDIGNRVEQVQSEIR